MIENEVLEHVFRHPGGMKRLCQMITNRQRLPRMFQDHRVPGDKCRRDSVDRRHIRIVPWCDHHDRAPRRTLDHTPERITVFDLHRSKALFRDIGHVSEAFVEPAEFAAVANGATHLMGNFGGHALLL